MKKIAVIQDLSGLGKCSLTAAIPVISVMGVQAVPLLTAVLSNQTGYPSYFYKDHTKYMEQVMAEWEKIGFCPDGIYTGFAAGEEQAAHMLEFLERFQKKETIVLVDPVMGDNGGAFEIYTESLREKMQQLVKNAQVITPNLTEALLLLYGKENLETRYSKLMEAEDSDRLKQIEEVGYKLLKAFDLRTAVITGVERTEEKSDGTREVQMGNLILEQETVSWHFSKKSGGSYSGTGDLFASVLISGLVSGLPAEQCVKKAVRFLEKAIAKTAAEGTDRNEGVCFESYLGELLK